MTQTATCVDLQPLHEVELAQRLESPSSAVAQTLDRSASDATKAPLPVEEIAIASDEPAQHREQQPDTTAPFKFDDAVLAGFRIGYRHDAAATAEKIQIDGASATQTILKMAGWIQSMKLRLNRKEFGVFVKGLLQWVGDEARKYLDIARAFEDLTFPGCNTLNPSPS